MSHPCNNPNLSPREFLEAVMHDDTFSIALRAKAPEQVNTNSQSKSRIRPDNPQPSSETPGPTNIETNSYPPYLENIIQTLVVERAGFGNLHRAISGASA